MPIQKLLIYLSLPLFFLGVSSNVDVTLARASDGGPQGTDKNS
jgi:hypothetical protein